ncbi:MAG: HhH-GPD protein [Candidatus Magasanikbacteria bacterium]|nr:HhH-GPD protein [Candidatus Magasanikbacteria bacterium]
MNVRHAYQILLRKHGPQGWWPTTIRGEKSARYFFKKNRCCTPTELFEICVGAILTQNTSWTNVTKALACLCAAKLMDPRKIISARAAKLHKCLRSSGYWRQKTKKLKIFSKWLVKNYLSDLRKFFKKDLPEARRELLGLWGIGEETADSILLYAGGKPIFVIDAYTKKFCGRHGVRLKTYDEYRLFFERRLRGVKNRVKVYQEFHALIVAWGKEIKKQ